MDETSRITSTEELATLRRGGVGYIVNDDLPTKTATIHAVDCRTLTVDAFTEKEIDGNGATGGWYFTLRDAGPAAARRCGVCLAA